MSAYPFPIFFFSASSRVGGSIQVQMACIENLHPKVGGNTSQLIPHSKTQLSTAVYQKETGTTKIYSNGLFTVNLLPAPLFQVVTSMFIYRIKMCVFFLGGGGGAKDLASNSGFSWCLTLSKKAGLM